MKLTCVPVDVTVATCERVLVVQRAQRRGNIGGTDAAVFWQRHQRVVPRTGDLLERHTLIVHQLVAAGGSLHSHAGCASSPRYAGSSATDESRVAERTATFDSTARATADVFRRVNGTPSKDAIDERTESAVTSVPSSPETTPRTKRSAKTGEKNATHAPPPATSERHKCERDTTRKEHTTRTVTLTQAIPQVRRLLASQQGRSIGDRQWPVNRRARVAALHERHGTALRCLCLAQLPSSSGVGAMISSKD